MKNKIIKSLTVLLFTLSIMAVKMPDIDSSLLHKYMNFYATDGSPSMTIDEPEQPIEG